MRRLTPIILVASASSRPSAISPSGHTLHGWRRGCRRPASLHGILFTAAYSFSKAIDDTPRLRLWRWPWPAARQIRLARGTRASHTCTRIAFGARHFPEPSFAWVQPSWFLLARLRSARYRLLPIAAARQRTAAPSPPIFSALARDLHRYRCGNRRRDSADSPQTRRSRRVARLLFARFALNHRFPK
jgi:hypothetical protein